RVTARHASSKEDLVLLLDVIGLPNDDDTLTALLPLLPDHAGETGMTERPLNATEATALSMYYDGADTAAITDATGLPEDETTATATEAPTPIRSGLGSGRTKEELADVRTWARANGYEVADKGIVAKKILDAYDAAHQAPAAKAS